jgi:hypothetical protein
VGSWPILADGSSDGSRQLVSSDGAPCKAEPRVRSQAELLAPVLPSGDRSSSVDPEVPPMRTQSEDDRGRRAETDETSGSMPMKNTTSHKLKHLLGSQRSSLGSSLGRHRSTKNHTRRVWNNLRSHGSFFSVLMAAVIVASSINVGLEIECDVKGAEDCKAIANILEHVFCVIFVIELLARYKAHGRISWRSKWFRFDAFLISISTLSLWGGPIIKATVRSESTELWVTVVSQATIVRNLRLLRLMRVLRLIEYFQEMWKLARGLMSSLRTVLAALVMIVITIYVFACFGMVLVNYSDVLKEDTDASEVMQRHFSTVGITMLTLIQFATGDGIADVYWPLVVNAWYLAFYFMAVWLVLTVVLMNLITAIIVENAISQAGKDRDLRMRTLRRQVQEFKPYIEAIFKELDSSGDGTLNVEEFKTGLERMVTAMQTKEFGKMPVVLKNVIGSDQLVDLFEFLDVDRSGGVDSQEFLDGVTYLALQSIPTETVQMLHLLRSQTTLLEHMGDDFKEYGKILNSIHQSGSTWDSQGEAFQHAPAATTRALPVS